MKILLVGDIHDDYTAAHGAYAAERPDIVLDCGDHKDIRNLFELTQHLYIQGNHEPSTIQVECDGLPLPFHINPGIVLEARRDKAQLRFAGIGGNYTSRFEPTQIHVTERSVEKLETIAPGSLDVFLVHESPLNVPSEGIAGNLAQRVIRSIDRIKPKYVFAGHRGEYGVDKTPGKVPVITLPDMCKGYGVLHVNRGNSLEFEHKISIYTSAKSRD